MYMQDHISLWSKAVFISRYWLSFDICAGRFSQRIPPTEACDVSHCKSIKWHMLPMELFCKSNVCQFLYCILLYGTVLSATLLHTFFGGILAWWRPKGLCQTNGVLWIYLAHTLGALHKCTLKCTSPTWCDHCLKNAYHIVRRKVVQAVVWLCCVWRLWETALCWPLWSQCLPLPGSYIRGRLNGCPPIRTYKGATSRRDRGAKGSEWVLFQKK